MAVFGVIKTDECVSLNDKFRIDATFTWITNNEPAITLVEIEPYAGFGYIDVTPDRFLDWAYSTPGVKTISLRITNPNGMTMFSHEITVKTEEEDCCFSDDSCLLAYEPDIMKYLPCNRTSFKYAHRKAAECIIDCLNRMGLTKKIGGKLNPKSPQEACEIQLLVCDQLKGNMFIERWATFWALDLIFSSLSTKIDDFFSDKAKLYRSMAMDIQNSPNLYIDFDQDGNIEHGESINWCKNLERK